MSIFKSHIRQCPGPPPHTCHSITYCLELLVAKHLHIAPSFLRPFMGTSSSLQLLPSPSHHWSNDRDIFSVSQPQWSSLATEMSHPRIQPWMIALAGCQWHIHAPLPAPFSINSSSQQNELPPSSCQSSCWVHLILLRTSHMNTLHGLKVWEAHAWVESYLDTTTLQYVKGNIKFQWIVDRFCPLR